MNRSFSEIRRSVPSIHAGSRHDREFLWTQKEYDERYEERRVSLGAPARGNFPPQPYIRGIGTHEDPYAYKSAADVSPHYGVIDLWYGAVELLGTNMDQGGIFIEVNEFIFHVVPEGVISSDGVYTNFLKSFHDEDGLYPDVSVCEVTGQEFVQLEGEPPRKLELVAEGTRVFLLKWRGPFSPRGVMIAGYEVAHFFSGQVTSIDMVSVGTYEDLVSDESGYQRVVYVFRKVARAAEERTCPWVRYCDVRRSFPLIHASSKKVNQSRVGNLVPEPADHNYDFMYWTLIIDGTGTKADPFHHRVGGSVLSPYFVAVNLWARQRELLADAKKKLYIMVESRTIANWYFQLVPEGLIAEDGTFTRLLPLEAE